MAVSDLNIISEQYSDSESSLKFSFGFTNTDTLASGYELRYITPSNNEVVLHQAINPEVLTYIDPQEPVVSTSSGTLFFSVTIPKDLIFFGQTGQFYLKVYKKDRSGTYNSNIIFYNFPVSKITDLKCYYDGYSFGFDWTPNTEPLLIRYQIEYSQGVEVPAINQVYNTTSDVLFAADTIRKGEIYLVHDLLNGFLWEVTANLDRFLQIDNSTLLNKLSYHIYATYTVINFKIYRCDPSTFSPLVLLQKDAFSGSYTFNYTAEDKFYFFRVSGLGGAFSIPSNIASLKNTIIDHRAPKIYPIYESEDALYGNPYFHSIKSMLVDANYYNKEVYALPLKPDDQLYSLRGTIGIYNSLIEFFIEGKLAATTLSDKNGEFKIEFNTPHKEFTVAIIAYVFNKSKSAVPISRLLFYKVLIHTNLAVVANNLTLAQNELISTFNENFIETASDFVIRDYFAKQIRLTYYTDDTEEGFRRQVKFLYPLLWNNNQDSGPALFSQILDFYKNGGFGISNYKILEKGDQFTGTTNNSFHLNLSAMTAYSRLTKHAYRYYVSTTLVSNPNVEAHPEEILFDYTIYTGIPDGKFFPAPIFKWVLDNPNQDFGYNIYRKIDEGPIIKIFTGSPPYFPYFFDTGVLPDLSGNFPEFGYCDVPPVTNLSYYPNSTLYTQQLQDYFDRFITIVLYGVDGDPVPEGIRARLNILFTSMLPPEMFLTLSVV